MKCPICKTEVDSLKTAVKNGKYISERCDKCLNDLAIGALYARKYHRDRQRETYRKDIIQRYEMGEINNEFVAAYPEQARKEWGDEVLRGYNKKNKLL